MKKSIILYTNNCEKTIQDSLIKAMDLIETDDDELIIIDDISTDETVPIIVGTIGEYFKDEEHYKFHINMKKKGKIKSIKTAKLLATNRKKIILEG